MAKKRPSTLDWEKLSVIYGGKVAIHSHRLKLPNGWIYSQSFQFKDNIDTSSCFIPDPNHEWEPNYTPIKPSNNCLESLLLKYKKGTLTEEEKEDLEAILSANKL